MQIKTKILDGQWLERVTIQLASKEVKKWEVIILEMIMWNCSHFLVGNLVMYSKILISI